MEKKNACSILVGKPKGKSPLGRPRHRWVDNVEIDLVNWISLAQDRDQWRDFVFMVMNLQVMKFCESLE
jgi:hypothetical protein